MFMKVSLAQNESLSPLKRLSVTRFFAFAFSILLIIFFSVPAQAQNNMRVRGRITNETGQPIPKVSVVVKGSTQGTTSNDNGDFELDAPSNGMLVVSSVGYASREVAVQQTVAVTL